MMETHRKRIQIMLAEGPLRKRGLVFIQEHYRRAFGTTPSDEPDYLFVALMAEDIIGTIGISVWKDNEPIRLARVYIFDWETSPRPVLPDRIFEYNRLIATARGISRSLIGAASHYAVSIGLAYGWCEHTDAVHRICLSFDLPFYTVDAEVYEDAIAFGDREFYRKNPSARLYMTDAPTWAEILADSIIYEDGVWNIP